jgi:hypothetical protein
MEYNITMVRVINTGIYSTNGLVLNGKVNNNYTPPPVSSIKFTPYFMGSRSIVLNFSGGVSLKSER